MNIDPQQVAPSARAGIELLGLRTTLIPGDLKAQVVVLESILMMIGTGALIVVPAPQTGVKLDANDGKKEDGNGDDSGSTGGE